MGRELELETGPLVDVVDAIWAEPDTAEDYRLDDIQYSEQLATLIRTLGERGAQADPYALKLIEDLRDAVEEAAQICARGLRAQGYSWDALGADQGLNRQAVLRRYNIPGTGGHVYRAYDANDGLLYIGSAKNAASRISAHKRSAPWRHLVARWAVEEYPNIRAARKAEREAIRAESPEWNLAGVDHATCSHARCRHPPRRVTISA
jgi:predicted GIY-YIG superfamily endonuclease